MITIRIKSSSGQVLAEWALRCDSVTAGKENRLSEGEVMCHGPDAVLTLVLDEKLINPRAQLKSRLDPVDNTVVWVEDNWPAFEKLFTDIESMTKD